MSRRKKADAPLLETEEAPRIVIGGGHERQTLVDPHTPLPGAIKRVADQRPPRRKPGEAAQGHALYADYLGALVRYRGDRSRALCEVLHKNPAEIDGLEATLHDQILEGAAGGSRSFTQTLKKMDLNRDARLMILREHMFSDVPAASLKAIDMLNTMEGDNNLGNESSYESYLRTIIK